MNFIFSREAFFKSGSFRSSSFKKCKMHQDKLLYFALKITYHWILLCKSVILINKDLVSGMKWMVFPVWRVLPGFVLLLCWSVSPSLWLDACSYSTATTSMYTLVSREKWNTTWAALTTTVRQPLKPALESLFQEENQERICWCAKASCFESKVCQANVCCFCNVLQCRIQSKVCSVVYCVPFCVLIANVMLMGISCQGQT